MRVKIKNNMQFGVPKDGILLVKNEFIDSYVGEYFDSKTEKTSTIRVKKQNCVVLKD